MANKITLSLAVLVIIGVTSVTFHITQAFYKAFAQGRRHFSNAEYEQAEPYLRTAFDLKPSNPLVLARLLSTYDKLHMPAGTHEVLEIAIRYDPDNIAITRQLADVTYGLQDYAEAERLYREILFRRPDPATRRKLAEVLLWQNKYDEALRLLEDLSGKKPDDMALVEVLADAYAWAKQYERAIALYKRLVNANIRRRDVALKLAETLRFAGRDDEAIEVYQKYLKGTE